MEYDPLPPRRDPARGASRSAGKSAGSRPDAARGDGGRSGTERRGRVSQQATGAAAAGGSGGGPTPRGPREGDAATPGRVATVRSAWQRTPRPLRLLLAAAIVGLLGSIAGVSFAALIHVPKVSSLADFQPGSITRVHDSRGEVFATFARERRLLLDEGELPELVRNAILAAEDANFLQHGGVDAEGVARAVVQNLIRGRFAMGGSTITMQLARKLFLRPQKSWRRKIEEAFLAVELEKTFSKQQILTLYANIMYLGHGNYGFEAAARDFFGKTSAELTVTEAATLAGILQRPSSYSPYRRPDLVRARRDYVLRRMAAEGFIDPPRLEAALAEPLTVAARSRERHLAPYFAEEVRQHLETSYGTDAVLDGGLQVTTTLDPRIQDAAERALRDGLLRLDHGKGWRGPIAANPDVDPATLELEAWDQLDLTPGLWNQGVVVAAGAEKARVRFADRELELGSDGIRWTGQRRPDRLLSPGDVAWFVVEQPTEDEGEEDAETAPRLRLEQAPELEGAALVLESSSGAIRGMVGGWSFERSKFNRAVQAKRQVGSAFKPMVFGTALENGFTPADALFDGPVAFPTVEGQPPYSPRNYYRKYYGILTLRRALELSINVTSVKLLDLVGADQVVAFARRHGIESELPPYPSLALGAADLTPLEVTAAFATVANHGVYVQPYLIERVADGEGRELELHRPRAHHATTPEVAFVLSHMLAGVIDRGTGTAVADLDIDLAGKTGTTDDYSDAWFVGFTPRYTLLVWVGYDQKRRIGRNMTGAVAALPIWRDIVEDGLETGWLESGERFRPPPGVTLQPVEHLTGLLPGPGARHLVTEAFLSGTQPVLTYQPRWDTIVHLPWYQQRQYYLPKVGERMPEDWDDWQAVQEAWSEKDKPATGAE